VALCLNAARGGNNSQQNNCVNTAFATGGNVFVKDVDIVAAAKGNKGSRWNNPSPADNKVTVLFRVEGGDATAIAACLNLAAGGNNSQQNNCDNAAVATGGNVVVKDVDIIAAAS